MNETPAPEEAPPAPYRVLARKYRPADFSTLIGQDALVRTLSNALRTGRLAQAYVLTGVRGVGKTTTARIIARALNCIGPDGTGGPTVEPCGVCEHCRAIAEDRHVDVLEMDAASRTGVNDMREILEGVRYRPTSARYKVYIIDEVHMLSTAAFNALLKTLEEPPEHVKFIFATTEIRKVPVTVLSRCQRFDLRRVQAADLIALFRRIAEAEQARVEEAALALLARAADGSVRDGLSLLDQAIAHTGAAAPGGEGVVTEAQVRDMLGLADREVIFDLFEALMAGNIKTALAILADQYAAGADPVVVLGDLMELTHWLTRLKITPDAALEATVAEAERQRGAEMAQRLSMAVLTRAWQMLLKGLTEARTAPSPLHAVEMGLIRLAHAADLPTPAEVIARLQAAPPALPLSGGGASGGGASGGGGGSVIPSASAPPPSLPAPPSGGGGGPVASLATARPAPADPAPADPAPADPAPQGGTLSLPSFEAVVALFKERKEPRLAMHLERDVHLVRFAPERLEFNPTPNAPRDLSGRVGACLKQWTGRQWWVTLSSEPGQATLFERNLTGARAIPLVQEILRQFPEATIGVVRDLDGGSGAGLLPFSLPAPDPEDFNGDDDQ